MPKKIFKRSNSLYNTSQIKNLIEGEFNQFLKDDPIAHFSFDSRSIQNGKHTLFFALNGVNRKGEQYIPELIKKGVRNFVVNSNYKLSEGNYIKVTDTLQALQLLAVKHRQQFSIPIIGITGSHGKTIVKEWLYQLLKDHFYICRSPKSYNSQIGVPISVLQLNPQHTLGIFEAGISTAGEMKPLEHIIKPTLGVFTGLGDAHNSGFESKQEKLVEKFKLFKSSEMVLDSEKVKGTYTIPFKDKSSIQNCLTCIAVLEYLKFSQIEIQQKIAQLNPIALRMEMRDGKYGNTILNDTYNISIESLSIALKLLEEQATSGKKVIIISDIPEYDYSSLLLEELIHSIKELDVITVGNKRLTLTSRYTHFNTTNELKQHISSTPIQHSYILVKGARHFALDEIASLLEEKKHQTTLTIDLNQLERNLQYYRKKLDPTTKLMIMVKAFAYGSGTTEIPKFLQQQKIDYLGVAYTDEGVKLREQGVNIPIIVMNPEPESFSQLIDNQLEPNLYSFQIVEQFIRALHAFSLGNYPIHLKMDTGMNRLGFKEDEVPKLIQLIKSNPDVQVKSIFSHLSSADNINEKTFTLAQLDRFSRIRNLFNNALITPPLYHILNTAGIENYPRYQFDMVRLGIGLYGIDTSFTSTNELKPIISLNSVIIQIKNIKKGESVGYNRKFIANQDIIIGTVPIGYADGIRRSLGNGHYAFFVNGKFAPTVGNICMDTCMVNLTHVDAKEGDSIEIFGIHQSIENIASAMETIPYEVMTSISQRVKRIFIRE